MSEIDDRSVYQRFRSWSKGDKVQSLTAVLLILGSLIYQIWQDPKQLEFVKVIATVFVIVALIEEYFKVRGKAIDLEKDKVKLDETVIKIEKALQAGFIKNKYHFHSDVMGLFLKKIEDYLDGDELDSKVVKSYREMINHVLIKSKKYAGMIENKYKDFLEKMLTDREQEDVPISEFKKIMILDKLKEKPQSEFEENIEENIEAIDDFNKE